MTTTVRPGAPAGSISGRNIVTDMDAHQLPDGRWRIVVKTRTAAGKTGRITVEGLCFLPTAAGREPWESPTLVIEAVPCDAVWQVP